MGRTLLLAFGALLVACGSGESSLFTDAAVAASSSGAGAGSAGGSDVGAGGAECSAGEKLCGSSCVVLSSPDTGCASDSCAPCSFANATAVCAGGACALGACVKGYDDCDGDPGNGCEVHTATDAAHCGSCAKACSSSHATPTCTGGECVASACEAGYDDCNASGADGCETQLGTDGNCTACGDKCGDHPGPDTTSSACTQGACFYTCKPPSQPPPFMKLVECDHATGTNIYECNKTPAGFPSYGNCDGMLSNGCETFFNSVNNCGACGNTCADIAGACQYSWTIGFYCQ